MTTCQIAYTDNKNSKGSLKCFINLFRKCMSIKRTYNKVWFYSYD